MVKLLRAVTRPELNRGLEGVVVDTTELSAIDGDRGKLVYRGYDIRDLARHATYEEVLYLLWEGELPTESALQRFTEEMAAERDVEPGVLDTMAELAAQDDDPMAALRTGVSMISAYDPAPDADPEDLSATRDDGRRIAAQIPTILAAFERFRNGADPVEPNPALGHAENFLYMLTGEEPDETAAETFDMALILHADHGFNASTFTTLVIVSTYADMYNAAVGGIGALSGHWHGGANQDVMYALMELDESDLDPTEWVKETLEAGGRIPGWGHRVYNVKDPRANILEERSALLADSTGVEKWHSYTKEIERYLTEDVGLPEKQIAPNVDFFSGTVYYQLDIPIDLYTPIFAVSRIGGWVAHVLEYLEENRLIRPRARYVGSMDRDFIFREDR